MGLFEEQRLGTHQNAINVQGFIQKHYTPYVDEPDFLQGATERTKRLADEVQTLLQEELKRGGILDIDLERLSGIDHFPPGYITPDRPEDEVIVGLQTDRPLKRMLNPYGGVRMVKDALKAYQYPTPEQLLQPFDQTITTHNQGVFQAYTAEMKKARHAGLLSGLPDAYGRGRIIGDFRRIALYGLQQLIDQKSADLLTLSFAEAPQRKEQFDQERHEVTLQIESLKAVGRMAASYGYDLMAPAASAREAVQHLYFGYLAGVKENNGAAMSLGRVATFLDIFIEKDIQEGRLTELEAQELIDQFVLKLRLVRHLRTPEYNQLFAGDPNWVTEAVGGMGLDGRTLVTKTSYRMLQTLYTLGMSPEPNLTILWSEHLPEPFQKFCAKVSIETDAIQYENDDLMRPLHGDDYAIACCVSAMTLGKQMQFFGARCNLAKVLLYSLNQGRDEMTGEQVLPTELFTTDLFTEEGCYDYQKVWQQVQKTIDYTAKLYIETLNTIHTMHDRYAYEAVLMALHDTSVERLLACGVAGLSVVADSLSAIKHTKTRPLYSDLHKHLAIDFERVGEYPAFGNDDDRVDDIAVQLVQVFNQALSKVTTYRAAIPTLSVLTITSNVIYGKKTGNTPDGRRSGEPFAPGANPLHGRERQGALASLNSVAKIPYKEACRDGISNTFTIVPKALGHLPVERIENLTQLLKGYFAQGAHHLNVNVLDRSRLMDAMERPECYPNLTIRVSGYAVHFAKLTRAQQEEVISRTFHERV